MLPMVSVGASACGSHSVEMATVAIQRDPSRQSAHVKALVLEKCEEIEQRIERLRSMQSHLADLASQCSGDEGPDCAILDGLAGEGGDV